MSSFEEFGPYLLLKKLGEDPLGETFRAGKVGGQGVEQVVLLRIFNGRTINGTHLWQTIRGRAEVQQALRSPNIGSGVDLGEIRGVPYAAYDYISGKSLASLLVQASTENTPIPADHALLIAERLALALATAQEAKVDGERIVHGFVVPHLAMISNEGEARLLGFEVAPGLRDLARSGAFGGDVSRYLAPEALAAEGGGAVDRADDVYSLGVILFELLTCAPLPQPGPEGYGAVIDAAEIPQEGGPLPPEVAALLKKSLVPRDQRIADAPSWHKAVSKLLVDGGYNATTFNLAFFMHNLFRSEIERESQEIEAEKTIEIPAEALAGGGEPDVAAAGTATAAAAPPPKAPAARPSAGSAGSGAARAGKGRTRLWAGLAAALVLLLGGASAYYFTVLRGPDAASAPPPAAVVPPESEPPPPLVEPAEAEPAEPAGPTPEELQAQLTKMIESRSAEMEAKLKAQYDERIRALQSQLQDTQEAAARREAELREQQSRAAEAAAAGTEEVPAPAPARPTGLLPGGADETPPAPAVSTAGAAASGAGGAPTGTAVKPPAAPAGAPGGSTSAPAAPAKPPVGSAGAATAPAKPSAQPPPAAAPAREPPTPEPRVRVGDLVSFGPGVKPPELIRMPDPAFPSMAKRLNKSATVEVRVLVDEKGDVLEAEISGAKAGFGFDQAALESARRATYKPALKDGVRVKMWTLLKVRFAP